MGNSEWKSINIDRYLYKRIRLTHRIGYDVEINTLWHNTFLFTLELEKEIASLFEDDMINYAIYGIMEVYDRNPPNYLGGSISQVWSISKTLRIVQVIKQYEAKQEKKICKFSKCNENINVWVEISTLYLGGVDTPCYELLKILLIKIYKLYLLSRKHREKKMEVFIR